jgi:hypothetical protein
MQAWEKRSRSGLTIYVLPPLELASDTLCRPKPNTVAKRNLDEAEAAAGEGRRHGLV